jgi:O6-methylguanine-DNA--protein-cysteine methyltransferase
METAFIESPLGITKIVGDKNGISEISVLSQGDVTAKIPAELKECVSQLREYFDGQRQNFDFRLNPQGTEFQQKVWQELLNIPFGKTISYLDLFHAIALLVQMARLPVTPEACGAKNGCWNMKAHQDSNHFFNNFLSYLNLIT